MASHYRHILSKLVPLLRLVVLLPLEHVLGSVLPLAALGLGSLPLATLLPLLCLVAALLVDVVGGVDDVGHGLAVVLLLAVAEPQSTLAAHLQ